MYVMQIDEDSVGFYSKALLALSGVTVESERLKGFQDIVAELREKSSDKVIVSHIDLIYPQVFKAVLPSVRPSDAAFFITATGAEQRAYLLGRG